MNMDDIKTIEQIDQAKMRQVIAGFPQHARLADQLGCDFDLPGDFSGVRNIVFGGMGGSAIGAEIISCYLRNQLPVPVYVNRDYTLPNFVNRQSLVILESYSGNTEETLSIYAAAQKAKAKIIILTSGGKLRGLAEQDGHPYLLIPGGYPPRGALAFLCFPVLALLNKIGLIEDQKAQVLETITVLENLKTNSYDVDVPEKENLAKQLAGELFNHFCVIYAGSENLGSVVTRWKGQLAENSKTLASSHTLPEMNHNEIVGWQYPQGLLKQFIAVFLRDSADHPQVQKRIAISKEILEKEGLIVKEINSSGSGLLARTFSLIYLGDFVSLYLAILNQEDPTPVKRIDYLKQRLQEWK
ncbi:bifunctional phosphoglucose/phosphomannose isomerase [Candidatus Omnitrophota bacterium]